MPSMAISEMAFEIGALSVTENANGIMISRTVGAPSSATGNPGSSSYSAPFEPRIRVGPSRLPRS